MNHHVTILRNCLRFFQKTFNGLSWQCFFEQTIIQLGQVQTCHGFNKILVELNGLLEYTKLLNSTLFLEGLECKVLDATSNFMQWFEYFNHKKDKLHWIVEMTELWDKVAWWVIFNKNFLKKVWLAPWIEEGAYNFFSQIGNQGILWIPNTTIVQHLSGEDN